MNAQANLLERPVRRLTRGITRPVSSDVATWPVAVRVVAVFVAGLRHIKDACVPFVDHAGRAKARCDTLRTVQHVAGLARGRGAVAHSIGINTLCDLGGVGEVVAGRGLTAG